MSLSNSNNLSEWINLEELHLLAKGDKQFILKMLSIYEEDFPAYLKQLEGHIHNKDWDQVRRLGHRMKSPASTVRVKRVFNHLEFFETYDPSSDNSPEDRLNQLKTLNDHILADLEKEKIRLSTIK